MAIDLGSPSSHRLSRYSLTRRSYCEFEGWPNSPSLSKISDEVVEALCISFNGEFSYKVDFKGSKFASQSLALVTALGRYDGCFSCHRGRFV